MTNERSKSIVEELAEVQSLAGPIDLKEEER